MVRTQIQLTEAQAQRLKQIAASEDVSMATLIRRSIDQYVQHRERNDVEAKKQRALTVVGKYSSQRSDVSQEHDLYLAELYAEVGP
jgi:predicted transcriptional regulator